MAGASSPSPTGNGAPMDAELALTIPSMIRPDLHDLASARELMGSAGVPVASAEAAFADAVRVESRVIGVGRGQYIEVRVYTPLASRAPAPGVLLLHGGGFVAGDLATEHARCLRFAAEAGCVVVTPEYGLAPERAYPEGLEDCYATFSWMAEDAAQLGIDSGRLALAGVSAGGALAAGVGLLARDRRGPVVRAQLLLYPVLDDRMSTPSMVRFVDSPVWDRGNNNLMWLTYLAGSPPDGYAAPARAEDLAGLPPTYLLVAEVDPLRDEGLAFGSRLLAAGVPVDIRLWAGTYHVFDQLAPDTAISQQSLDDQVRFLRRRLGAGDPGLTSPARGQAATARGAAPGQA